MSTINPTSQLNHGYKPVYVKLDRGYIIQRCILFLSLGNDRTYKSFRRSV